MERSDAPLTAEITKRDTVQTAIDDLGIGDIVEVRETADGLTGRRRTLLPI